MKQNLIWMYFLLIGVISIMTITFSGCKSEIDYSIRSKWIYINETGYSITFQPLNTWNEFNIQGFDTISIETHGSGPETVTNESFIPPINVSTIVLDSIQCDTITAKRLSVILEYESKQIGERNFEFTFRYSNLHPYTCK